MSGQNHLCHDQGDLDNARRYAVKALELYPGNTPEDAYVHNNVGVACLLMRDYAGAEEFFRGALAIEPGDKTFRILVPCIVAVIGCVWTAIGTVVAGVAFFVPYGYIIDVRERRRMKQARERRLKFIRLERGR